MKIKMNVICRKDKLYKNNTAPIHIRFTLNRQIRYVSTGFSIALDDWDFEQQRIKAPLLHLKDTQHQIDRLVLEYERKIKRLEVLEMEVTFENLLNANSRKTPNQTVSEYFNKLIDGFRKSGKLSTASKYSFCLSSLDKFRPTSITFDKVDKAFLSEFEQFLRGNGLSSNTIATKFTNLKSAYNKALEDGIFVARDNPFTKYKVGKLWSKTRKRAITKVITFLEDRRVLYVVYELESPRHCAESVIKIRDFLTEQLFDLNTKSELGVTLKAMRSACRKFLNTIQNAYYYDKMNHHFGMGEEIHFYNAMGELRATMGILIGKILVQHGIDCEGQLIEILPLEQEEDI